MSAVEELKGLRKQRKDLETEIAKRAKSLFKDAFKELFTEHPNLVSFGWRQYTPYFNDGDACYFNSYHTYPFITFTTSKTEDDEDYDEDEEYEWSEWKYKEEDPKTKKYVLRKDLTPEEKAELKTGHAVIEFLSNFDNNDMEQMFGDHKIIRVSAKGVEVDDYNHN